MFNGILDTTGRVFINILRRRNGSILFQDKYKTFLKHVYENGNNEDGGKINYRVVNDHVSEIVINHPKKRNSITGRMMNDLAYIADEFLHNKDKQPFAVIIRGTGDFFCSGADLSLSTQELNTPEWGVEMSKFMTEVLNKFRSFNIISLCILNGPALGGGAELATSCDFRIMCNSITTTPIPTGTTSSCATSSATATPTTSSYIRFVHASIGASPGWGGATRLYSIVGRQYALKFLGTSEKILPTIALKSGLVDEVFDISFTSFTSDDDVINRYPTITTTSTTTTTTTTIKDLKSSTSNTHDTSVVDAIMRHQGLRFLQPFLNQPYKSAVSQIKSIIAAADEFSVTHTLTDDNNYNNNSELQLMRSKERAVFGQSWASPDNKKAIAEFMSRHHHKE